MAFGFPGIFTLCLCPDYFNHGGSNASFHPLPWSAVDELASAKRLNQPLMTAILKPPGRAMADGYYNQIPRHVDANAPLKINNQSLWMDVSRFYTEIRNPLFHGHELEAVKAEPLRATFLRGCLRRLLSSFKAG